MWRRGFFVLLGVAAAVASPISRQVGVSDKVGIVTRNESADCEWDGVVYHNGEPVPNLANPCETCICSGGEVECSVIQCEWRNDCEGIYTDGVCCPSYDHCPPKDAVQANEAVTQVSQAQEQAEVEANEAITEASQTQEQAEVEANEAITEASQAQEQAEVEANEAITEASQAQEQAEVEANEAVTEASQAQEQAEVEANEAVTEASQAQEQAEASQDEITSGLSRSDLVSENPADASVGQEASEGTPIVEVITEASQAEEPEEIIEANESEQTAEQIPENIVSSQTEEKPEAKPEVVPEASESEQVTELLPESAVVPEASVAEQETTPDVIPEGSQAAEEVPGAPESEVAPEASTAVKEKETTPEEIVTEASQAEEGTKPEEPIAQAIEADTVTESFSMFDDAGSIRVSVNGDAYQNINDLSKPQTQENGTEEEIISEPVVDASNTDDDEYWKMMARNSSLPQTEGTSPASGSTEATATEAIDKEIEKVAEKYGLKPTKTTTQAQSNKSQIQTNALRKKRGFVNTVADYVASFF